MRLKLDNMPVIKNTLEEKEINEIELSFYVITGKVIDASSFIKVKTVEGGYINDIMECR